jgi:cation:H+ antiporter
MIWNICLLLAGCGLLLAGAHWLVKGAAEIAVALKIPKAIVGLSLVAFGTSAPELIINLIAAYQGETRFALANVSGSNLTNLLVGFGLCGILGGITIAWRTFSFDLWALVLSAMIPLGILLAHGHLPLWSVFLLGAGVIAYVLTIGHRFKNQTPDPIEQNHPHLAWSSLLFLLGAVFLYGGGHLVLEGAIAIAEKLQIDSALVGLTIVAAGTSIPDAIASIIAARRGEHEIAVGNLLGSNIANILVVLSGTLLAAWAGSSAGTVQLSADWTTKLDYAAVLVASIGFFGFSVYRGRIGRRSGSLMIVCFCLYMGFRIYLTLRIGGG